MRKRDLFLLVALPVILAACTPPLPRSDSEDATETRVGTSPRQAAGIGAGAKAGTMVNEYISQQENTLAQVFAQSEDAYVLRNEDSLLITLQSDVLFDTDSTALKVEAYNVIHNVAEVVNKYPETSLVVSGHTDSTGSEKQNMSLSEKRALVVREALVADKVASKRITTQGYGESNPLFSNATEHGKQLNRRVTIEIIPVKSR